MVTIKTPEEIQKLREGGKILAGILSDLAAAVAPGVSSLDLENLARKLTADAGAKPAFLGYHPAGSRTAFPAALCLSVNDTVVHGIPNKKPFNLNEGDIAVLDMGIVYKGMYVDSAITVGVGKIDTKAQKLLEAGQSSLDAAMEFCKNWTTDEGTKGKGIKTGDLGEAIERSLDYYHKTYGFNMAENIGGHGVGYDVHEDPYVPNFGKKNQGVLLKPGMVIAVEPIINEGKPQITLNDDEWSYRTIDGKRSSHFEHTIVITEMGAEILTQL